MDIILHIDMVAESWCNRVEIKDIKLGDNRCYLEWYSRWQIEVKYILLILGSGRIEVKYMGWRNMMDRKNQILR